MLFSQRKGYKDLIKELQLNSIDEDLKNGIWTLLVHYYWDTFSNSYGVDRIKDSNMLKLSTSIWVNYFKKPLDTLPIYFDEFLPIIRNYYYKAEWYEIYDLTEFIINNGKEPTKENFIDSCNIILKRENSAYRFVAGQITEITNEIEIKSVENAIKNSSPYAGVKKHLQTAMDYLYDRKNPNYRNSIRESISSIESLAKQISSEPKAKFAVILNKLEAKNNIHPALNKAFRVLYGYTSDTDKGIRHALLEEGELSKSEAQFMLIACSAFVNYIIDSTK